MAEFYAPQFAQPDILGSYIRGQAAGQQAQMFPYQLQGAQQDVQAGGLKLDQLRMALQNQHAYQDVAFQQLRGQGYLGGAQGGAQQTAANPGGGIQNGPQGSVSAPTQASGSFDGSVMGFSPQTLGALATLRGDDPLKTAQGVQEYQKTQMQLQAQGPLDLMDSVFNSDQPARTVMANPSLISKWPQLAQRLGLDPVKDFNDGNVRRVLAFAANQVRGQAGMPAKDYPVALQNVNLGQGEVAQIDPVTGQKKGDLTERQTPTFDLVDQWDPATGTTRKVPVQKSGWGMAGVSPVSGATVSANRPAPGASGAPGGGAPAAGPVGFNVGYEAPKPDNLKAAMFASEMRSGMETMRKLEADGYNMSPRNRAAFINAATSEDAGILHQLMGQEALSHGFSAKDQQYMAAMMPVLQAAGHDQSGARLTTSQVRQNIEGLIPVDSKNKEAMEGINKNRNGFYIGLLGQAGSAAQLPQYRNTLLSDLKSAQQQATGIRKTVGGKTYVKQGGKWYAE